VMRTVKAVWLLERRTKQASVGAMERRGARSERAGRDQKGFSGKTTCVVQYALKRSRTGYKRPGCAQALDNWGGKDEKKRKK